MVKKAHGNANNTSFLLKGACKSLHCSSHSTESGGAALDVKQISATFQNSVYKYIIFNLYSKLQDNLGDFCDKITEVFVQKGRRMNFIYKLR